MPTAPSPAEPKDGGQILNVVLPAKQQDSEQKPVGEDMVTEPPVVEEVRSTSAPVGQRGENGGEPDEGDRQDAGGQAENARSQVENGCCDQADARPYR